MDRYKNIIEWAQDKGSSAKTTAGARKYLMTNLPKPHLLSKRQRANSTKYHWDAWHESRMARRADGRAQALGYPLQSEQWAWYCEAYEINRQMDRQAATRLYRDNYGSIFAREGAWDGLKGRYTPRTGGTPAPAGYFAALDLLKIAPIGTWDDIEFDRKGRAEGDACHVELFDFSEDGTAIVVCQRRTEGTKYGVKTISKTYLYVRRIEDGTILVSETNQPVARLAKQGVEWGVIVRAAETGERPKLTNGAIEAAKQVHRGFKAVRINDDGNLVSVWDNSPWDLGTPRKEFARNNHKGGLYYYRDINKLLQAVEDNDVFGDAINHHRLLIVEVEATGRHICYGSKYAASQITPIRPVASTL